jgi:NAD(P)-dependent dehydrogenase (short-subunit alcohol dehydrogenase family)
MQALSLFWRQHTTKPPIPNVSFAGQTVIITGANTGLGFEAAKTIARLGAEKLIIAVRSLEKGEAAKKEIETTSGRNVVEVWHLDMASYQSVKEFAAKASQLPRIDVLLLNAGIATRNFTLSEGEETTITVNVIATYLLGLLLLPKLKETAVKYNTNPHMSFSSSELHYFTNLPERKNPEIFAALSDRATARMMDRYNVSKLLVAFLTRQLVAEVGAGCPVIINYFNPGFCKSGLSREEGAWFVVFAAIMGAWTTEQGSRCLVSAVSSASGKETHGHFLNGGVDYPPSPFVRSQEGIRTQKRVWDELKAKLETIQPGVLANLNDSAVKG